MSPAASAVAPDAADAPIARPSAKLCAPIGERLRGALHERARHGTQADESEHESRREREHVEEWKCSAGVPRGERAFDRNHGVHRNLDDQED